MKTYTSFENKHVPTVSLSTRYKRTEVPVEAVLTTGQLKAGQPGINKMRKGHFLGVEPLSVLTYCAMHT